MKYLTLFLLLSQIPLNSDAQSPGKSKNPTLEDLQIKIESLQYNELVQSMTQRSLLTPNYFPELKALVARQAFNFWQKSTDGVFVSHKNIYASLHDANKYLDYDSANRMFYNQIVGHTALVISLEFGNSPDVFYSAGSDGKVLKWNLNDLSIPPIVLFKSNELFRSMDVSYDDNWLLVVTKENGVILINTQSSQSLKISEVQQPVINHDTEPVQSAIFVPNELKYITVTKDGKIKMKGYGLDSIRAKTDQQVKTLAVNGKNKEIYAGTERGVVQIWNEQFNEQYLEIPELYAIKALDVSTDQTLLAIGREKGDAVIWDMVDKKIVRTISGHQSAITDIEFSPDDKLLLTASRDGTARIWDIYETKKLPIVLDDHNDWVMTACFDRTGTKVLTGSKDNMIRVWPLDPQVLADRICSLVSRNLTQDEWDEYIGPNVAYTETCPAVH